MKRTVQALLSRGFDNELAKKLAGKKLSLNKLKLLKENELKNLGISTKLVQVILKEPRPPIPPLILKDILYANRSKCCVCREDGKSIIVHHISPWHISKSHDKTNLAVLCLEHHDKAHARHDLSLDLTEDRILDFKAKWEENVRNLDNDSHLNSEEMNNLKRRIKENNNKETNSVNILTLSPLALDLINKRIVSDYKHLARCRFFNEFDRNQFAKTLATEIISGGLQQGNNEHKCLALSWCARILSTNNDVENAKVYLGIAKQLGRTDMFEIVDALILSSSNKTKSAFKVLATINSPLSRSTSLFVASSIKSNTELLDWIYNAGINVKNIDSGGKYNLINIYLKCSQWESANQEIGYIEQTDLDENPALNQLIAIVHLINAVPDELKPVILNQVPFESATFPLNSSTEALSSREMALKAFVSSSQIAKELDFTTASALLDQYVIWLELRSTEHKENGQQHLIEKLRDDKHSLIFVPLAMQFGTNLNIPAIEQKINQQIALNDELTYDAAFAKFALIYANSNPVEIAEFFSQNFSQLSNIFDKKYLLTAQIEGFARAKDFAKSEACFKQLIKEGVSSEEEARCRIIMEEAGGIDQIEERKNLFEKTDEINDLINLIRSLRDKQDWVELSKYCEILYGRTGSLDDANKFAMALDKSEQTAKLISFYDANPTIRAQSDQLQVNYCWALFFEGRVLKSKQELSKITDQKIIFNYLPLKINIGITLGDWESLSDICDQEYHDRENRSAHELMGAAILAAKVNNRYAENLVFAAVEKGKDDPDILSSSFFLASNLGFEDNVQVGRWIADAIKLSDENGPVQSIELKDLINLQPNWNENIAKTSDMLSKGEVLMYMAAQVVKKPLYDLILYPAISNLDEKDPRRRAAISSFSGTYIPQNISHSISLGLDATTIITLEFLGLLQTVLETFKSIKIPHSTLAWLLEEKKNIGIHQPSRLRDANDVRNLVADGTIEKLIPESLANEELSELIGEELALLISAASVTEDSKKQKLVICSYPENRVGSLVNEIVNLSEHTTILSNCLPIVEKLWEDGEITEIEVNQARSYLNRHEKERPDQPKIENKAILHLDSLSVTYLSHIKMIEKIKKANFQIIISPKVINDSNGLIKYSKKTDQMLSSVENVRKLLNSFIQKGKIEFHPAQRKEELDDYDDFEHPTYGMLSLSSSCDAIASDDRYLNAFQFTTNDNVKTPIINSIDLIDTLVKTNKIDFSEACSSKTRLRQAGYFFVPITERELKYLLSSTKVINGKIIESVELRAIRENFLQIKMNNWLQLPKEVQWLNSSLTTLGRVLKQLWSTDEDSEQIIAKSKWLLELIDIRGWTHSLAPDIADNMIFNNRFIFISQLTSPPLKASPDMQKSYLKWIDEELIEPIKDYFPDIFKLLVDLEKQDIQGLVISMLRGDTK